MSLKISLQVYCKPIFFIFNVFVMCEKELYRNLKLTLTRLQKSCSVRDLKELLDLM